MQTLNIKIKNKKVQIKLVYNFNKDNLDNILNNNIDNIINSINLQPLLFK